MPSKKKKYNARFPAGRIKKIMQTDEEVGKVAQAVPIIISRTLELFVESLLTKTMMITESRSAKTLTPSHLKQCIQSESRFDFLKDLVRNIPDASIQEDNENNAAYEDQPTDNCQTPPIQPMHFPHPLPLLQATTTTVSAAASSGPIARMPVIQFHPRLEPPEPQLNIALGNSNAEAVGGIEPPPLVPIVHANNSNTDDSLYIDEDYDN